MTRDATFPEAAAGDGGASDGPATTFPGELYVKNGHKSFGVTKALDGVSFSAKFGEIHAIVGGNGCGKSTLAKVISGVLTVDRGKVSVLGHVPESPKTAKDIGILTVFQEVMVADQATVLENLFVGYDGFWTKKLSYKQKYAKAKSLMKELTAEDIDPEQTVGDLPLSIKAWITIGRAILCDPKVLILDESSAALDFDSTERLFAKMRELRDRGAAVLIVTHRIAELIRISDRATVMRDGRDVGVLEKEEITEDSLLSLMTGQEVEDGHIAQTAHRTESKQSVLRTRRVNVWPDAAPVDFDLLHGEIVGVTGLDGHGQDDFVRVLAGVESSFGGWPEVWRPNLHQFVPVKSLSDAKSQGISFVSGDRKREGILPNLSIFENLVFPLYRSTRRGGILRLIDWTSLASIFDWEVERLSIKTGPPENLITSLSGGNQQKVLIGRAFAQHPDILILNDPARGIDVEAKSELYKHLRAFAKEGGSVIYMSSELEEFIGLCSRVLVFRNGSVFDEFLEHDVEPVGLLEGMFGRKRDGGGAIVDDAPARSEQPGPGMTSNDPRAADPPAAVPQPDRPPISAPVPQKRRNVAFRG